MTPAEWITLSQVWVPVFLALIGAVLSPLITWWVQRGNTKDIAQIKNGLKTALLEKTAEAGFATGKLEGELHGREEGLQTIKLEDIDRLKQLGPKTEPKEGN